MGREDNLDIDYADQKIRKMLQVRDRNPAYETAHTERNLSRHQASGKNNYEDLSSNSDDKIDDYDYMGNHDDYDYMRS